MEAALVALETDQRVEALEALLEAWRRTRNPQLAGLVEALSVQLDRSLAPIAELTRKAFHQRWVELAFLARACDVSRLLKEWTTQPWNNLAERVERLSARPDDPRVAMALARFVEELPTTHRAGDSTWTVEAQAVAAVAAAGLLERVQIPLRYGGLPQVRQLRAGLPGVHVVEVRP